MIADRVRRRSHAAVRLSSFGALCAALLAGCADLQAPEYARPESPAKASWSQPAGAGVSAADAITPDWWREFGDPYLDNLVNRAIGGNFDLKLLAARIRVAGAQIDEARAGALPTVDVAAGAIIEKSSGQPTSKRFDLGAQVSWEIDIWGKFEKGAQAQTAEYRASEADWRAGYLTLVASVATTYFQILQFDEQIDKQQRALDKNKQILAIYVAMFEQGVAPETQVRLQRAEVNRLTNGLLDLRRLRDLAENALATLTGVPARSLKVPSGALQERVRLPVVPLGLPSQLLARRPDIVAAEYRVLSAYDLVGQAKLAQLPSINLAGRVGTASLALSDLLKTFTGSFLPSINLPLFDPGIRARIKTNEAQVTVAEDAYRRVIMTAFEEVENALVNLDAHRKQRTELEQQVEHLGVAAAQIQAQLREGVVSQLEVFEAERQLLAAQLALLAIHQQILSDTVTLYMALGGGWPTVDVRNASNQDNHADR